MITGILLFKHRVFSKKGSALTKIGYNKYNYTRKRMDERYYESYRRFSTSFKIKDD